MTQLIQCCLSAIKTLTHNQSLYCISPVKRWSFFFQNNPKNLDPSYKTDLDIWDLIKKGKTCIIAKFHRTDLVICSHSREFYYQMEFIFLLTKSQKNLDPSYKMDLDLWDFF